MLRRVIRSLRVPHAHARHAIAVIALVPLIGLLGLSTVTNAAEPASGSIGPSNEAVEWNGPPPPDGAAVTSDETTCEDPGAYCDHFNLTVAVSPEYWDTNTGGATVTIEWEVPAANDFDLYIFKDGNEVDHSATGAADGTGTSESVFIPKASGDYEVRVVYFTVVGEGYHGTATFTSELCKACGGATFSDTPVVFDPTTVVNTHLLGGEPQITMERRVSYSEPGSVNSNRIFIDWPFSSRSNTGILNRSMDGGRSFRLIYDPTCAARNRPNCATGGGGDTEEEVNLASGHVFFSDQEVVANEAYAVSVNHGDTFVTQSPATNGATGTDRQWLTATDNTFGAFDGPATIEAFLTYHIPLAGQYIQAIDSSGVIVPQPVPQVAGVGQSGQPRVDTHSNSPGHQWIYQPYRNATGGVNVATAFGPDYANPGAWVTTQVTEDSATSFPWTAIDRAGNVYLTWDRLGKVYYSVMRIADKENNPDAGGRPGTFWSPAMEITLPGVGSAVFTEVIAGGNGRIAVTYVGTTEYSGLSDDAPDDTLWDTYASVITNATQTRGAPVVSTGLVNHRPVHRGNICTSGTACLTTGRDRSFLDMIDIGFDQNGRIGVVYQNNYSTLQDVGNREPEGGDHPIEDIDPTILFSKLRIGPSITRNDFIHLRNPGSHRELGTLRPDPAGDARWPNTVTVPAPNLPALDTLGAHLLIDKNGDIEGHIRLKDTTEAGMLRDLALFNTAVGTQEPAQRLQYILRFETETDIYHLSMDFQDDGTIRFFGGKVDQNDGMVNPLNGSVQGVKYSPDDSFEVTGEIRQDEIRFHISSASLGFGAGTPVYSVSAFCTAGPLDEDETVLSPKRTVDASPPFDTILSR